MSRRRIIVLALAGSTCFVVLLLAVGAVSFVVASAVVQRQAVYVPSQRAAPYTAPRGAPYVPPQYSVPSSAPLVPPQYVADPSKSSWQEDERQRALERQQRDAEQRLRDAERQSCQALQVAVANRDPNAPYDAFAPRAPLYCP